MKTVLAPYQADIEKLLCEYLATQPRTGRLSEACVYALLNGGKRFRPALVQMMSSALHKPGQADQAALAIEFFHTASLIADDLPCMDDDDERRSQPSLHRAFDEATALLVSYALISAGYGCLAQNGRNLGPSGAEICLLALENVATNTGIAGATGGQWLDLFPPAPTESALRDMMQRKTGALFEVAFVLGWLFGGGNPHKLDLVKRAAAHFGMAFQIADDLEDQEQDLKTQRSNLAIVIGPKKAMEALESEMAGYQESLQILGIHTSDLARLGNAPRRIAALI
jgi:geranylgeranyl diphosphate synthase type II